MRELRLGPSAFLRAEFGGLSLSILVCWLSDRTGCFASTVLIHELQIRGMKRLDMSDYFD